MNPFLAPVFPLAPRDAHALGVGSSGGHADGGGDLYGPDGCFAPAGIKKVYDLTTLTQTGTGQMLGLAEFDGYVLNDIQTYENFFAISPNVPLQNVMIDGYDGSAGSSSDEVTLDSR